MKGLSNLGIAAALCIELGLGLIRTPQEFEMHILDVGQGDSILLRTEQGKNVLIDGGPDDQVLEELGEVLPLWDHEIDLLVLTHPDSDHSAGLVAVLQRFKVDEILMSAPTHETDVFNAFLREVKENGVPYTFAAAGETFDVDGLHLEVLWPLVAVTGQDISDANNVAVVLRATEGVHSVLLTADIEASVEEQLVASGVNLSAEILKAPHHGSHSSSTVDFLKAVGPTWMLISCGAHNDYGHPHQEVLDRAEDMDIQIERTDLSGRISVIFNQDSYKVVTEY